VGSENSPLPDSCAGFDITERFSQKLQHLFYQSVVNSCWLHRVWCCTAVWVMGAYFCSLCVYCVQSYEHSLCLYWALVKFSADQCIFIYHCMCHQIFTLVTLGFTFSTRKRYEPECVLTPETILRYMNKAQVKSEKSCSICPKKQISKTFIFNHYYSTGLWWSKMYLWMA
jgi:hypothetical protein